MSSGHHISGGGRRSFVRTHVARKASVSMSRSAVSPVLWLQPFWQVLTSVGDNYELLTNCYFVIVSKTITNKMCFEVTNDKQNFTKYLSLLAPLANRDG